MVTRQVSITQLSNSNRAYDLSIGSPIPLVGRKYGIVLCARSGRGCLY